MFGVFRCWGIVVFTMLGFLGLGALDGFCSVGFWRGISSRLRF